MFRGKVGGMSSPIPRAWAKLADELAHRSALPLTDHGGDVAAVFAQLVAQGHWQRLLNRAAERELGAQDVARLCVLAYLHDLGKANRGFWLRQFPGARLVGHTRETAPLLRTDLRQRPEVAPLVAMLRDWGCGEHFAAVMAHHGTPLNAYSKREGALAVEQPIIARMRSEWAAHDGYDPLAQLAALLGDVAARFPLAFAPGPPLPPAPAFVALLGGLVTLADWLGSDTALFPVAGPHDAAREALRRDHGPRAIETRGLGDCAMPAATFEALFGYPPRGAQSESDAADLGAIALIEAETGSGKTEAALWRWLALRAAGAVDGLYFALPTRSAAVQLHGRVNAMLQRLTGGTVEAVLAVPGYIRAGMQDGRRGADEAGLLPGFAVTWPDDGASEARWAAEQPKRYLAARVAVGTIDQALMAGLQLRHAHFRAAMLARSLLVVDEVHASDHFMGETLRAVLRNHLALGGHALLLSATLSAEMRGRLLDPFSPTPPLPDLAEAQAAPSPALSGMAAAPRPVRQADARAKVVAWTAQPIITDAAAIAAQAIAAARAGASVLVIRNSVAGAVAVAQAVATAAPDLAFAIDGVATLHHGRFAPDDRRLLDRAVEAAFGKGRASRGQILCGTQTLEQSLDIDADLLLTDLAPIDVLLQRIGRLHRHDRADRGAFARAQARILVPAERDLARFMARRLRERHGLGPIKDAQGVYPDLLVLEATWRLIERQAEITIPADNRRLVEQALHPQQTEALVAELGTAWANHEATLLGTAYAERGTARDWTFDVAQPFTHLLFPEGNEALATRLGTKDRLVRLDPAPPGPFGQAVGHLTVPAWMAPGVAAEEEAVIVADTPALAFTLGARRFVYDRWGLQATRGIAP